MSLLVAENIEPLVDGAASQNAAVQRTGLYLSSRDEPLSACLHTARSRKHVDHGVVICPPIGFEQLHAHRSLRHLADAVAAQGIPTLRFDWHGTGDSAGSDADPSRLATWQANIRDVVAWMRTNLGCRNVSVVGLRMGAMLAVEALDPGECDNLVLWAPVVSGKSYVRQMQAIDQLAESRPRPIDAAAGDVEAAGFLLSQETVEELAKTILSPRPNCCSQALLVGPCDKRLVERFTHLDIRVDCISPPGYVEMMAEPHLGRVPRQAVREIADWLGTRILAPHAEALTIELAEAGPSQTMIAWKNQSSPTPTWGRIRERQLRIGDVELFGILSEPVEPSQELPMVVILNAGSAHHVGPGRLHVELARHLAGQGFSSLRLDIRGLGESVCSTLDGENNPYPATVFRDVELTLHELRGRFGMKRCVLLGLCSGAYAAFQSAAQLADSSLVESILINPLTFYWHDGMSLDTSDIERQIKEHSAIARATNLCKLRKFLGGKTEIGYRDAARLLVRRMQHRLKQLTARSVDTRECRPITALGHPDEENLPADLTRIVAAKRRLAMFLAENDPGLAIMSYHARSPANKMRRNNMLHISTIPRGDHTFSRRAAREQLLKEIADYLRERHRMVTKPGRRATEQCNGT